MRQWHTVSLPRIRTARSSPRAGRRTPSTRGGPTRSWSNRSVRAAGCVEDVATLFLTNRECPFRCLMCDLWRNTTDTRVPPGAIPQQIDYALARLPAARHIKLYNSGNFFDHQAIPPEDYAAIAERVRGVRHGHRREPSAAVRRRLPAVSRSARRPAGSGAWVWRRFTSRCWHDSTSG